MKSIAVISDLHLGDHTVTDNSKLNEDKLIVWCKQLLQDGTVLVINGDLFDCWQPRTWDEQIKQFNKVRKCHYNFVEFLLENIRTGRIIYVSGNHDAVVRTKDLIPGVLPRYILEYSGKKFLFEHGHQGDEFNHGSFSVIGQAITWLLSWCERLGWRDADNDFAKLEKSVLPDGGSDNNLDAYAAKKIKEGYALVVLGHTHSVKQNGGYVNTGCALASPIDITKITIFDNATVQVAQSKITL